ncbi:FAD-dependent oxidoreductase [Cupriavidus basilensis]|uniref:FAD-dependent oxidoreductase n=1 Tax=Cupriavidus basilensis TaxID=68895 RepID=A0ABT6AR72_9BURK|nr:FAD-dependent oxidoreductase [Cupriavidus basilensis]MDF3835090.1 FAD-dependent oxidoreductase [Cupriavidus basilensis]
MMIHHLQKPSDGAIVKPFGTGSDVNVQEADVIVVGAGFSGLTAARNLHQQGMRVLVLEARDRVGGRTMPGTIAGLTVDLGGMWAGPTQTALIALADEFGVERFAQPLAGKNIVELGQRVTRAEGENFFSARSDAAKLQYSTLLVSIEALAADMPARKHWHWHRAAEFDGMTLAHWLDRVDALPEVKSDMAISCRALLCAEVTQVSFLHFLFYVKSGGGFATLTTATEGAQKWLFKGGVHQIAQHLAASLPPGAVKLGTPVHAITRTPGAVLATSGLESYSARALIMALPPAIAGRIDYQPPLDARRDGLMQRLHMGSVIKCYLAYDRPFWRQAGLNGLVLSDTRVFSPIFDVSPPDQSAGLLCGFIDGRAAVEWSERGSPARRSQFIAESSRWFGDAARNPVDYLDLDWTREPWSRGCYGGYASPGTWTGYGDALCRNEPPIFWAGTETSSIWYCYIEGAIGAGQRAAQEVLADMAKRG